MRAKHARQIRAGVVMAQRVIQALEGGPMITYQFYDTPDLTIDAYFATLNTQAMRQGYAGSQVVNRRRRSHARGYR